MKKRILILVNHYVVIYNFRKEIVQRLVADGFEVWLSCPVGDRIDELKEMGCNYIEADIERHGTNPLAEIKLIRYYSSIMKDIKPDAVLSYTIKPNLYGGIAAAKLNIPYIANITGLGTAVEYEGLMQKLTLLLYKYAFRKVSCVFVQNNENKQFFVKNKISVDKLRLIPGSGVNLDQFSLLEYPSCNTLDFVFISRIMKKKGIEHYLEAAKYICRKYPNTRFHICGFCEEDYEKKLAQLQEQGIIIYHGMVRDVTTILKDCCCTIHPTYYPEGLSNVLLESCACGRPIITTDRSGCREVVDNGINGYMIKQNDTQSLIDAIEKFIGLSYDKKKEMGLNGRKKVEREFDRQIVVEAYVEEMNRAIN